MRPTRLTAANAACLLILPISLASHLLANSHAVTMMAATLAGQQGSTGSGVWDQRHLGDPTTRIIS